MKISLLDDDKWIVQGVSHYLLNRNIYISTCETFTFNVDARPDVLICELTAFGSALDDSINRLLVLASEIAHGKFIILTHIREGAMLGYINKRLPFAKIVIKSAPVNELIDAIFNNCHPAINVKQETVLSKREFSLLRWFASDYKPGEIGRKLNLSIKTISHYKMNIYRKLGCENSLGFYLKLVKYGYIRTGDSSRHSLLYP